MHSPEKGVVYIATGKMYINEALLSAKSLKHYSPGTHVTLFTDEDVDSEYIDSVEFIPNPAHDFGDSILTPEMLPYDRTLFIDTDTFICADVSDAFSLLDRFDIAAAHNPGSRTCVHGEYEAPDVPDSFPQYNTGVLLLEDTDRVHDFLTDWKDRYEAQKSRTSSGLNQPAFRDALYHSRLQIATLPSEYNLRVRYDGSVGFMTDRVKIVHGRHPAGLPRIAREVNKEDGMRVYSLKKWPIELQTKHPGYQYYLMSLLTEDAKHYTFRGRLYRSLEDRGVRNTLSRVLRDIKNSSPFS